MRTRIWIALHALVVLLPVIGALAHARDARLFGVESENASELPALSFASWRNERLQPAFQAWFEAHIGFRGVMVRTDNTVQQRVLGETKPGSDTVLGNDGVLFFRDDLTYAGRRREDLVDGRVIEQVDRLTLGLGSVHRKLAARGKHLAVMISPSKTHLYPEAVPPGWRRGPDLHADVDVHEALRAGLERNGVPFADARALLTTAPAGSRERELVFGRTGRHWTTVGACRVMREALLPALVLPSCDYDTIAIVREEHVDFDLDQLLNRWHTERYRANVPIVRRPAPTGSRGPRTVMVGTSFMWMLVEVLRPLVDTPLIALFYNKTAFELTDTHRRLGTVDPASPEWVDWVLERDLYVLDILETYADKDHMIAFVETLNQRLD